ncbi:glycosyltransferase family 4 protein [Aneurinibacillus sp. Ricciae_BoGa-3]|uniref:glycosyltransferase family 4 protein n=1 Tax=Aneurinibacillus sp. Ricciae_BoGa-3 TaxID=3022697 RepID=UPI002340E9AE|nr:glycosyltransferase family 4 protein [Aneurinibacillus sp. Ricciae_BoGa-3]WCK56175.1 glycosyltransferase family 4 protein [Aneurinibacillus sp. Ricciae_BoGa-3]
MAYLKRKDIVYVLEATGVSGGIKNVFEHVNHLHDMGYRVHLFALDYQPNWFHLKVQIRKFNNYQEMLHILKMMDAIKVATWWKTLDLVLTSCDPQQGGRGIPFYLVQDIEESYYPDSPNMQEKVRQTYKTSVNFLTIADWTTQQLAERFHKQATNVSIAIDLNLFKPNRTYYYDPFRILACSRNSQHLKGFGITAEAVEIVYRKLSRISLFTFGPEPPNRIQAPTRHFPVPNDTTVADLYANCGVFVQTSFHEGFGMPILEAMACGAPVVTTKAEGNEEFCINEYNCLMVDKGDVEGVANAIYRVLTDGELRNHISANGINTAQKYNWSRVMNNLDNVFSAY